MGLTKPQMYTEFADGINTVFYDANSVIGLVFGEEEASAGKLVEAIREQARMHAVSERSARVVDHVVLIIFTCGSRSSNRRFFSQNYMD